jgi:hypothetical protein
MSIEVIAAASAPGNDFRQQFSFWNLDEHLWPIWRSEASSDAGRRRI